MSEGDVFHEKQRLELCAIHALNNVLQERVFTKETADDICKRTVQSLCVSKIQGFILNVPSRVSLGIVSLPLRRRHWLAVRQVNGQYYNLDSKLKSPMCIGGEAELRSFLSEQLSQDVAEMLLVVQRDVEEDGSWLNPDNPNK
ncbi:josephin-2 isoform X2 [Hippoglossus stenolepis]|uniref:josephin-2 isoform X2 n=1 Tax=Hippoglossus stenolepis TaxID=195615 RepID=UPI00159C4A99|nr:josephin-2 isoform X2 [Hippoglossus stenolepis]